MNEKGHTRFRIQLICDYPCEDKYTLRQKEGELYISKMPKPQTMIIFKNRSKNGRSAVRIPHSAEDFFL